MITCHRRAEQEERVSVPERPVAVQTSLQNLLHLQPPLPWPSAQAASAPGSPPLQPAEGSRARALPLQTQSLGAWGGTLRREAEPTSTAAPAQSRRGAPREGIECPSADAPGTIQGSLSRGGEETQEKRGGEGGEGGGEGGKGGGGKGGEEPEEEMPRPVEPPELQESQPQPRALRAPPTPSAGT